MLELSMSYGPFNAASLAAAFVSVFAALLNGDEVSRILFGKFRSAQFS
jgi:hypothetical protein